MSHHHDSENALLRIRLIIFGGVVLLVFLGFSVYLFNLQIVENLVWEGRAKAVASRSEPLLAQRGLVWDRNYDVPLATNIDSFAVQVVPAEMVALNPNATIERLAAVLDLTPEYILERLPVNWANSWNTVKIADNISYSTIVQIAESSEKYPGVYWQSKPYRWYNSAGAISHSLGYVGDITTEELQMLYNQGYANTASLGKAGIEKAFDGILRGKNGQLLRTVDVKGRNLDDAVEVITPKNGMDIVLTIDRNIQELAEKALGPRKGALVVLKPTTGEILAMVSYPSFDPNSFKKEGPGNFKSLSLNTDYPFLNRSIQSAYAPASTFKLIVAAAILGENAVDPNMTVNCRGVMTLGNREFGCHKRSGHGRLNLAEALEESCNIYFGTIGVEFLGIDVISKYARAFGLGSLTGIELDGETAGIVPGKDWKEKTYSTPWTSGDTLNSSIGQGFLTATPLQMANVLAAIANNGTIYQPHILKEIRRSGTGVVIESAEPKIFREIDLLEEKDYSYLQAAMRSVITEGTGEWAIYTESVDIVGKTGTGEIGVEDQWHDWFVAYGPYQTENPDDRVVVVALVEASQTYDWWAPKATDIVFEGIFSQLNYEEVIAKWQKRRVWWSWDGKDLPKPGWPLYEEPISDSIQDGSG